MGKRAPWRILQLPQGCIPGVDEVKVLDPKEYKFFLKNRSNQSSLIGRSDYLNESTNDSNNSNDSNDSDYSNESDVLEQSDFLQQIDDCAMEEPLSSRDPPSSIKRRKNDWEKFCESYTPLDEVTDKPLISTMALWIDVLPQFPRSILASLLKANFLRPTPIQSQCLMPAIQSRKDIVAAAETGSGKTLAFGIPLVSNIIMSKVGRYAKNGGFLETPGLEALIFEPSRELAIQAARHIRIIAEGSPVRIVEVVGGLSHQKQLRLLDTQLPDIVVGTPGRLHMLAHQSDITESRVSEHLTNFDRLRYLVFDEADRLVERGHFKDLELFLTALYKKTTKPLQTFIYSATLSVAFRGDAAVYPWKRRKVDSAPKVDFGSLSPTMRQLLLRIKLRESDICCIDLSRQDTILKLPETLILERIKCEKKSREEWLYTYLYSLFRQKTHVRILIFVNSISYVLRLESLLRLSLAANDPAVAIREQYAALKAAVKRPKKKLLQAKSLQVSKENDDSDYEDELVRNLPKWKRHTDISVSPTPPEPPATPGIAALRKLAEQRKLLEDNKMAAPEKSINNSLNSSKESSNSNVSKLKKNQAEETDWVD